jgi:hypothetical protein
MFMALPRRAGGKNYPLLDAVIPTPRTATWGNCWVATTIASVWFIASRSTCQVTPPGVIALVLFSRRYATRETYVEALGEVMRSEYEAIVAAGLDLQFDCPTSPCQGTENWVFHVLSSHFSARHNVTKYL